MVDAQNIPFQVNQDLIWVWGESGSDAGLESALSNPPLIAELEDTEGIKSGTVLPGAVSRRDLAYGWDTFLENIMVRRL